MWIESHQSLRNHPKVKKAARLAGINEFEMIGRLHCLWWWALDYAPDGDVTKYSAEDIESAVDWDGKSGALYSALIGCGFNGHCGLLEKIGDSIHIHDWNEYGGKLLEKREANKARMREARALHVRRTTNARTGATEDNRTEQKITEHTEDNNSADKPRPTLTDTQQRVLSSFNAKRFKNDIQRDAVLAWSSYPQSDVDAAITWAATKGLSLGQAIASITKALPGWNTSKKNGNGNGHNGNGIESTGNPMLDAIARAQKEPGYYGDQS